MRRSNNRSPFGGTHAKTCWRWTARNGVAPARSTTVPRVPRRCRNRSCNACGPKPRGHGSTLDCRNVDGSTRRQTGGLHSGSLTTPWLTLRCPHHRCGSHTANTQLSFDSCGTDGSRGLSLSAANVARKAGTPCATDNSPFGFLAATDCQLRCSGRHFTIQLQGSLPTSSGDNPRERSASTAEWLSPPNSMIPDNRLFGCTPGNLTTCRQKGSNHAHPGRTHAATAAGQDY